MVADNTSSTAEIMDVVQGLEEGLGSEFVADLLGAFLQTSPAYVTQIHQGLDGNQPELLQRAAHTLKSNAQSFGAWTLADLCQQVESLAEERNLAGVPRLLPATEREYDAVRSLLASYREELMS